jgi:hypothetical protein
MSERKEKPKKASRASTAAIQPDSPRTSGDCDYRPRTLRRPRPRLLALATGSKVVLAKSAADALKAKRLLPLVRSTLAIVEAKEARPKRKSSAPSIDLMISKRIRLGKKLIASALRQVGEIF